MMLEDTLAAIEKRYEELNGLMTQPDLVNDLDALQQYAREQSALEATVGQYREYKDVLRKLADAEEMLGEDGLDAELQELAEQEVLELRERRDALLEAIKAG